MKLIRNYYLNKLFVKTNLSLIETTVNCLLKTDKNFFNKKHLIVDDFKWNNKEEEYIKYITKRICDNFGICTHDIVVSYAFAEGNAGIVNFVNNDCFIEINSNFRKKHLAVSAIIAHELTHVWLKKNAMDLADVNQNEKLTDIMAIFLGAGILLLNGSYEKSVQQFDKINNLIIESEVKPYIISDEMGYAFALFMKLTNKGIDSFLQYCEQKTIDMFKIGNGIIEHRYEFFKNRIEINDFIIFCPNCFQKLKITAGKKAKVKCPNCDSICDFSI